MKLVDHIVDANVSNRVISLTRCTPASEAGRSAAGRCSVPDSSPRNQHRVEALPPSGRRGLQRSPPRRPGMGVQEVLDLNRVDVLPPDTTTSFNRSTRYKRHTGRRGTSSRPCGSHHHAAQCGLIGVVPVPRLHVRAPVHHSFARSRGRAVPAVIAFAAACADTSSAPCPSLARPQLSAINADPPFWSSLSPGPGPGWWESLCGRRLTRCSSR